MKSFVFLSIVLLVCSSIQAQTVKILPLGDSITNGAPYSYRYDLYQLLVAANYDFDFIGSKNNNPAEYPGDWDMDHEGHGGSIASEIDSVLALRIPTYQPDIVLLLFGTNDMFHIMANKLTLEEAEQHAFSIVNRLRDNNPNVRIFLALTLPFGQSIEPPIGERNLILNAWNEKMRLLADTMTTEEAPITIVDINTGFGAADFIDRIHPTEEGGAKIAERWANALLGKEVNYETEDSTEVVGVREWVVPEICTELPTDSYLIYPNPFKHHITIEKENDCPRHFSLYNQEGETFLSGEKTGRSFELDLSALPIGIYFVEIGGKVYKLVRGE